MTLPPCEFSPNGSHSFAATFWGRQCEWCGRVADIAESEAERRRREDPPAARRKISGQPGER